MTIISTIEKIERNEIKIPELNNFFPKQEKFSSVNEVNITHYEGNNNLFSEPPTTCSNQQIAYRYNWLLFNILVSVWCMIGLYYYVSFSYLKFIFIINKHIFISFRHPELLPVLSRKHRLLIIFAVYVSVALNPQFFFYYSPLLRYHNFLLYMHFYSLIQF